MEALGHFFIYAMTAIFLENAVFTRTLGIGRLAFSSSQRRILIHGTMLTAITFISSFLCYAVNDLFYEMENYALYRPLFFLLCVTAVYLLFVLFYFLLRKRFPFARNLSDVMQLLPVSAFNCAVIGSLVLSATVQRTLPMIAGFGLGAGIGYTLALLLIFTGHKRMELVHLPRAFKGMPIMLLYIGIVSLAIYGLIGHQLPT